MRQPLLLPLVLTLLLAGCGAPERSETAPEASPVHAFVATYEDAYGRHNDVTVTLSDPVPMLDADGRVADMYPLTIKEFGFPGSTVCGLGADLLVRQCSLVCLEPACDEQFQTQFKHRGAFPPAGMLMPVFGDGATAAIFGFNATMQIKGTSQTLTMIAPADRQQTTTLPGQYTFVDDELAPQSTGFASFDPGNSYTLRSYERGTGLPPIEARLSAPTVTIGATPAFFPGAGAAWFDMPETPADVLASARLQDDALDEALKEGCILQFMFDRAQVSERTDLLGFKSWQADYGLILKDGDQGIWDITVERTAYEYDGSIQYETYMEEVPDAGTPVCHAGGPPATPGAWLARLALPEGRDDDQARFQLNSGAPGSGYADGYPELWRYILTWDNADYRLEPNRIIYNPHTNQLWQVTALHDLYSVPILNAA